MSVGDGIFLSSVFLGTIALFIATKDRWNWHKIVVRSLIGIVAIIAIGGTWIYGWDLYNGRPQKPVPMSKFWDIPITASKGDIKFLKGSPDYVHKFKSSGTSEVWAYGSSDDGKAQLKKGEIAWDSYLIGFRGEEIRRIGYIGYVPLRGPNLQGIDIGDSPETIIRALGNPTYVSVREDELTRVLSFASLNLYFELKEGKVFEYGILNPKFGPAKYEKEWKKL